MFDDQLQTDHSQVDQKWPQALIYHCSSSITPSEQQDRTPVAQPRTPLVFGVPICVHDFDFYLTRCTIT